MLDSQYFLRYDMKSKSKSLSEEGIDTFPEVTLVEEGSLSFLVNRLFVKNPEIKSFSLS